MFSEMVAMVETVLSVLLAVHVVALFVVNLTPTPKDDVFLAKVYAVIEVLAGIMNVKAKEYSYKEIEKLIRKRTVR